MFLNIPAMRLKFINYLDIFFSSDRGREIFMQTYNLQTFDAGGMRWSATDPPYLYFPGFAETGLVTQAFSTRLGGVSSGYYATLNFGMLTKDDRENVLENYHRMAAALGTKEERMVLSHQSHTTNLRLVTAADAGKGLTRPRDYENVDGLLTNVRDLTLVTFYADCVPLFFVDPVKKAIALSHSGWRGTAARMGAVTVARMRKEFGSDPADILAGIGPSICRDCYEVDDTVYRGFAQTFSKEQMDRIFTPGRPDHYQLDLWLANRLVLQDAGLLPAHIETAGLCTSCHSDWLFSHRATGGKRGLLCAFLRLN